MEFVKRRLGNFQMLAEPLDDALIVEMNKAAPDFEQSLYYYGLQLKKLIDVVEDRVRHYVNFIKQEAELKGIKIVDEASCCHRSSCMTCLGQYPAHYPYFRIVEKPSPYGSIGLLRFIKKEGGKRYIKKRELKDFLRAIGIPEERIKRFIQLCDLRDFLVSNYHCQIITFKWAGLSSIELV